MSTIVERWLWIFHWLIKDGGSRATVLLVFITGWYAFLTNRMARSMSAQTRALIQPTLQVQVKSDPNQPYPKGTFSVKNVGSQPVLLLDMTLSCTTEYRNAYSSFELWDEHLLPPGEYLEPLFDFTRTFTEQGQNTWMSGAYGYLLEVSASDLSRTVALTYRALPVLHVTNVKPGFPWRLECDIRNVRDLYT